MALKPCPLCGGKADYLLSPFKNTHFPYRVKCTQCGFATGTPSVNKEMAANIWNRRAPDPELNPCPLCGSGGHMLYVNQAVLKNDKWYVGCCLTSCDAQTAEYDTREEAVHAWNTRIYTEQEADE